jgi:hypothetical protein
VSTADRTTAELFDDLLLAATSFANQIERADTSDDGLLWLEATAEQIQRRRTLRMTEPLAAHAHEAVAHAREQEHYLDNLGGAVEALLAMLTARDMSEPERPPAPDPDSV